MDLQKDFPNNLPDNLLINKQQYIATLGVVYKQADNILKNPRHSHYTDHTIAHSERILFVISKLIEQTTVKLNDEEKLILISAVLLHDIGMQAPDHYIGATGFPLSEEQLELIRRKHHEYSYKMIIDSVNNLTDATYNLGLSTVYDLVEYIAIVAKHHRKQDIGILGEDVVGNSVIRLQLLSALIRLGDCLDFDRRRVDIDRLLVFTNIPVESKFFWFCHYYISGEKIENGKIELYLKLPKSYENSIVANTINSYVYKETSTQLEEVYRFLYKYGIRIYKDIVVHTSYANVIREMPDELIAYITQKESDGIPKGVIYGKLNLKTRSELVDAYIKCLDGTNTFRNMLVGPTFLSPYWFRERVMANKNYKDFDSLFLKFAQENSSDSVNDNIKLIFRNTQRYVEKVCEYLSVDEYNRFFEEVLKNTHNLWGDSGEKGPKLCCVDPGYMHIITVSDVAGVITQRLGTLDPTRQGYFTSDTEEISGMKANFDEMFDYHYSSQYGEINKLRNFIKTIIDEQKEKRGR